MTAWMPLKTQYTTLILAVVVVAILLGVLLVFLTYLPWIIGIVIAIAVGVIILRSL